MPDFRPFEDETTVNQVWNEIVAGLPSAPGVDDSAVPETIRRLHALGAAAPPASSRERVRRGVWDAARSPSGYGESTVSVGEIPWDMNSNGHVPQASLARPHPVIGGPWIPWRRLSALSAAALLLAIVGAVIVVAILASGDPDRAADMPPIMAPASPSPAATPEDAILLEIDIPAAAIPVSDGYIAALSFDVVPAGNSNDFGLSCCDGPLVQHLVSGTLTFTVSAPVEVIRADGTTEQVAADTPTTLVAGETLLTRNEHGVTTTNPGPEPAEVLDWLLLDDPNEYFAGRQEEGWEGRDLEATSDVPPITGSVALTLRREVLVPGDIVPVLAGNLSLAVTADPEVDVFKRFGDGGIYPIDSHGNPTVIYVFTMIPLRS